MGRVVTLSNKDPEEVVVVTFDFTDRIAQGETLSGPVVTVAVRRGADLNVAQVPNGAPSISGATVLQSVKAGVHDADYGLKCKVTAGARTLVLGGVLPVRNAV